MGLITKLILIPLAIIGVLVVLTAGGAVWFLGWDNVKDILTTEEIDHNCDITNATCLDEAIAGKWLAHGCGQVEFGEAVMKFNSTTGEVVCAGSEVTFPEGDLSTSEAAKFAKEKIKFYCCNEKRCTETKTYYMVELAKYMKDENANGILNEFKQNIRCADAVWLDPITQTD